MYLRQTIETDAVALMAMSVAEVERNEQSEYNLPDPPDVLTISLLDDGPSVEIKHVDRLPDFARDPVRHLESETQPGDVWLAIFVHCETTISALRQGDFYVTVQPKEAFTSTVNHLKHSDCWDRKGDAADGGEESSESS